MRSLHVLKDLTEFQYRAGLAAVVLGIATLMLWARFRYDFDLPGPPPPPAEVKLGIAEAEQASKTLGRTLSAYESYLLRDSQSYGISPPASVATMARVFPHTEDRQVRILSPGNAPIEVGGLRLALAVEPLAGTAHGQMVLEIENLRAAPVAYRVQTLPTAGTQPCHGKRDLPHNAVALAPNAKIRRSECLYRNGWGVRVQAVEVMELPELAYRYVSAVPPGLLGLELRTARGHAVPEPGQLCSTVHAAAVDRSRERGEIGWRDLADFYARHRCQTYVFPQKYKAFKIDAESPLPAVGKSY